jgi:hypothetical protein
MILQVVVFLGDQQGVVVPCLLLATVLAYRMTEKEEVEGAINAFTAALGAPTDDHEVRPRDAKSAIIPT